MRPEDIIDAVGELDPSFTAAAAKEMTAERKPPMRLKMVILAAAVVAVVAVVIFAVALNFGRPEGPSAPIPVDPTTDTSDEPSSSTEPAETETDETKPESKTERRTEKETPADVTESAPSDHPYVGDESDGDTQPVSKPVNNQGTGRETEAPASHSPEKDPGNDNTRNLTMTEMLYEFFKGMDLPDVEYVSDDTEDTGGEDTEHYPGGYPTPGPNEGYTYEHPPQTGGLENEERQADEKQAMLWYISGFTGQISVDDDTDATEQMQTLRSAYATKAELCKVLYGLGGMDIPSVRDYPGFSDVSDDPYIVMAYTTCLIEPRSETVFGADDPVTLDEVLAAIEKLKMYR